MLVCLQYGVQTKCITTVLFHNVLWTSDATYFGALFDQLMLTCARLRQKPAVLHLRCTWYFFNDISPASLMPVRSLRCPLQMWEVFMLHSVQSLRMRLLRYPSWHSFRITNWCVFLSVHNCVLWTVANRFGIFATTLTRTSLLLSSADDYLQIFFARTR